MVDRRPLSARDLAAPPNIVSLLRLLLLPVALGLLATDRRTTALIVLAVMVLSDGLDGYLARRFDRVTELGKILDPVADKLAIDVVLAALALRGEFPVWALAVVILRDAAILAGAACMARRLDSVPAAAWIGKITLVTLAAMTLIYVADVEAMEFPLLMTALPLVVASGAWYAISAARALGRGAERHA